jgi:hypothetical protein
MADKPWAFDIDAFLDEQMARKRAAAEYDKAEAAKRREKARQRNAKAKREEAWQNREPSPFDRYQRGARHGTAQAAVLGLLTRDRWYTAPELSEATGKPHGSIGPVLQKLAQRGVVERRQNPDWDPDQSNWKSGVGRHLCKWEYRAAAPQVSEDDILG